jgi:hypothetical protein
VLTAVENDVEWAHQRSELVHEPLGPRDVVRQRIEGDPVRFGQPRRRLREELHRVGQTRRRRRQMRHADVEPHHARGAILEPALLRHHALHQKAAAAALSIQRRLIHLKGQVLRVRRRAVRLLERAAFAVPPRVALPERQQILLRVGRVDVLRERMRRRRPLHATRAKGRDRTRDPVEPYAHAGRAATRKHLRRVRHQRVAGQARHRWNQICAPPPPPPPLPLRRCSPRNPPAANHRQRQYLGVVAAGRRRADGS